MVGCSNEGRGVQGNEQAGLELPISLPRPEIEGTVLSKVDGRAAGVHASCPRPGFISVKEKPGRGGAVSAFTIT